MAGSLQLSGLKEHIEKLPVEQQNSLGIDSMTIPEPHWETTLGKIESALGSCDDGLVIVVDAGQGFFGAALADSLRAGRQVLVCDDRYFRDVSKGGVSLAHLETFKAKLPLEARRVMLKKYAGVNALREYVLKAKPGHTVLVVQNLGGISALRILQLFEALPTPATLLVNELGDVIDGLKGHAAKKAVFSPSTERYIFGAHEVVSTKGIEETIIYC